MKNIQKFFIALLITFFTVIQVNGQISLSIRIGPPALPVYEQPYCPGDGYLWIPGYWAYSDGGYYWVPGYWVQPPETGFYWTPGYWDYTGPYYKWHAGYWGRTVGYYGGIDYGYGYGGRGYYGGEWSGRTFRYNTAVTRINTAVVHNTYVNRAVVTSNTFVNNKRASFNGRGGVSVKPTSQELAASKESHLKQTSFQVSHQDAAKADRRQFAAVNNGHPASLVEKSAINGNHATTPKKGVIQNANANRTITNKKTNTSGNSKLKTPQKAIPQHQIQEKVNPQVLKQQQVSAANQRKQSVAKQQHAQQTNANNEKRKASQSQQQHVQQTNANNEKRKASQSQQQHVQQMNSNNEKRKTSQSQQHHTQKTNANNVERKTIQNQHPPEQKIKKPSPQPEHK